MTHPHLTSSQAIRAYELWKLGCDTHQIAASLKVSEAAVYNSLRDVRADRRRAS